MFSKGNSAFGLVLQLKAPKLSAKVESGSKLPKLSKIWVTKWTVKGFKNPAESWFAKPTSAAALAPGGSFSWRVWFDPGRHAQTPGAARFKNAPRGFSPPKKMYRLIMLDTCA